MHNAYLDLKVGTTIKTLSGASVKLLSFNGVDWNALHSNDGLIAVNKKWFAKHYVAPMASIATPIAVRPNQKLLSGKFTCIHQGKRVKVDVQYLKNGLLPWQPVKINTRFYFLNGLHTTGVGYRTARACQDVVSSEVAIRLRNMY